MQLTKDIEIIDLALWLKKEKTLIIADLHIGYEEALNKQGTLIPRFAFEDLTKRLTSILKQTNPKKIIINGDLKHEFGTISEQEWRDTIKIINLLSKYGKIILIKGNHDTILKPIAKKKNIEFKEKLETKNLCITHGHKITKTKKPTIIIGHEHPAISLEEGSRKETVKCFLKGKYKTKNIIVMPSLNQVTEGTNILKEKLLSPYLKDISNFKIFAIADKVYEFGEVKDLE